MDYRELKAELRIYLREEIATLPQEYVLSSDSGIFNNLISLREYQNARNIMLFHSVERETDTIMIANAAFEDGKTVAFPLCLRGGIMHAHIVSDLSELEPAMLGIPAPPKTAPLIKPEELDLIIVPALTYDNDGYRLGYGGGYYDRYLSGLSVFTAGLARGRLIKKELPRESCDIPVKCVVTEETTLCIR